MTVKFSMSALVGAAMAVAPAASEAAMNGQLDSIDCGANPVPSQNMEHVFTPSDLQCLKDHANQFVVENDVQFAEKEALAHAYIEERMAAVEGMNPIDAYREFADEAAQSFRNFDADARIVTSGRQDYETLKDDILGPADEIAPIEAFYINQNFAQMTVKEFEMVYGPGQFSRMSGMEPIIQDCELVPDMDR